MPRPCSPDLRCRVVEAIMNGSTPGAAAKRFAVSKSSAKRWRKVWLREGRTEALPTGGDRRSRPYRGNARTAHAGGPERDAVKAARRTRYERRSGSPKKCRFMLTKAQMEVMRPLLPKSRGVPRKDDRMVLGGILYVHRHGLPWHAAPAEYGPYKTLYSRWRRWSRKGVFLRILEALVEASAETGTLMMDSTFIKACRTACSLGLNDAGDRNIGTTKGGRNTRLHFLADARGRLMRVHPTRGQASDYKGAEVLLKKLPAAKTLLADRGYDSNKIRNWLTDLGIMPCIPPRKGRKDTIEYDEKMYERRHKIENSFSRLKDWHRVAYRRDRCPTIFNSAVVLAVIVIFWL